MPLFKGSYLKHLMTMTHGVLLFIILLKNQFLKNYYVIKMQVLIHLHYLKLILGIRKLIIYVQKVHHITLDQPYYVYPKESPIILGQTKVWHDKHLFLDSG